ncbi:hypothetical protein DH2020_007613 [Rehmannia glutinosa]|uniref:Uncharacterized protein n=1 Tax=Rehmannia glutinosa TaxID=99300 RepID=A0ABR0TYN1_REHGL
MVVASSPDIAKEFCKTHDRIFSGRHLPSVYHNLPGIMNSSIVLSPDCSKSWKLLRSIGQNCVFSSKAMESNAWIRKAKVMDLVSHLQTNEGKVANLEDMMFATLANIISTALTSRNLFDIHGQENNEYKDMMALVNEVIEKTTTLGLVDFLPILKGIDFWSKKKAIDITSRQGDELGETLLSQCHYFQACIKETLRLHVPAPMLVPHRALETCKVNNYLIPKDSMVLVNAWAIAQDPNYWEEATSFKPERFFDSKIGYRGTHFEYLPFGTGLRMCPGSAVAFKNIQMLVGSLLHYFDWSLPNGADPTTIDTNEKYFTTLKKEKPLLLIPKLRKLNTV